MKSSRRKRPKKQPKKPPRRIKRKPPVAKKRRGVTPSKKPGKVPKKRPKPSKKKPRKQVKKIDLTFRTIMREIDRLSAGPEDLHETGLEYYKLIAQVTDMTEHEAYSTILGYPPDEGITAT